MEAQYPHRLVCIIAYGAQALIQLALMKIFDDRGIAGSAEYYLWTAVDLTCWEAIFFLLLYRSIVRPKQFAL